MPINSAAPRRTRRRSGGSVSRPSPLSTIYLCTWYVMSGVISVVMGWTQLILYTFLNQYCGLFALLWGNQIQAAVLIIFTSAFPITQGCDPLNDLLFGRNNGSHVSGLLCAPYGLRDVVRAPLYSNTYRSRMTRGAGAVRLPS